MLISAENCNEFLAKIAVAPYVGAWIETVQTSFAIMPLESLPTWERGLKPMAYNGYMLEGESLPTWERGLKPFVDRYFTAVLSSLPTWERGLKPIHIPDLRLR